MRWVVVVGALAALGALALVWLARSPHGNQPASTTGRDPEAAAEIAELRREVAALRGEMGRQRAGSWLLARRSSADAAPAAVTPAAPLGYEERLAADQARAAQTAAAVAERFQEEAGDPAWSGPAAARIEEDLGKAGLAGWLRGVKCATTMCQVALELDEASSREHLAERLTELPAFRTQVLYQHVPGAEPPRLTLFLARPGHKLPLPTGR